MKRYFALVLTSVMLLVLLAGCGPRTTDDIANRDQQTAEDSGLTIHKIGVATYNL